MRARRWLAVVALWVVAAVALGGCGDDEPVIEAPSTTAASIPY